MKTKILLILIIVLAFALRVFWVDKFPAGFNADEAAIGYNAYSIIKTGKDEYGQILPLSFKSFGDYKPGLYFYFVIPFVATLGLDELAVRLPSVLLGTGMVLLIYLLSLEIFKNQKVGIISALFLAINPWAIHFSRGGWETNAATFFITLGVYFFAVGITNYTAEVIQEKASKALRKGLYLFWSLLSFLVSIYLYQSPRLVVPLLVTGFLAIFWKEIFYSLKNNKKQIFIYLVILFVLSLPVGFQFLSGGGSERFQGLSFFSDQGPVSRINELRGEHENPSSPSSKLFHNKMIVFTVSFLGHYLDHFSGDFLFTRGDPLIRNKTPQTGQFYNIQALLLVLGLIFLIKYKNKLKYLLVIWVLISPAASSLTYQTPHAVRALSMVIPLTLIMALGLVKSLESLKRKQFQILALIIFILILNYEFIHYLESYYIHSPKRYPLAWEYGFSEMVQKLNKYENDFDKVVITDRYDQPYILVLFYKKYDPAKYQPQAVLSERDKFNFGTVRNFDKYEFHKITPEEMLNSQKTLFIASPEEAGKNIKMSGFDANIIDAVYFPNGDPAFIFCDSRCQM